MVHIRQIEAIAYVRDDEMWDMEISLSDRKTKTFTGGARDHPAGEFIHGMSLICTMDAEGTIVQARASMDSVPFEESCPSAAADYQSIVGLNIFNQFGASLRERLGDGIGCSHLSALAGMLPTLAIQSFAGITVPVRDDVTNNVCPPLLGVCRGLRLDGEAVRLHWPRWYQGSILTSKLNNI